MVLILVGFLFSIALMFESIGVWLRVIGAQLSEPTTGYSTHVRLATIGRFFILLSAPSLGYLVDIGYSAGDIALSGCIAFSITSVFLIFSIYPRVDFFVLLFRILNNRARVFHIFVLKRKCNSIDMKILLFSFFSFLLTASGVYSVNVLGALNPNYRAFVVQLSALVTMFGTLAHVFFIDPILSKMADSDPIELVDIVYDFLIGRIIATLILASIFLLVNLRI